MVTLRRGLCLLATALALTLADAGSALAADRLQVSIGGVDLPRAAVAQITVDQDLGQPDMVVIVLEGRAGLRLAEGIATGDDVQVDTAPGLSSVFKGEVVAIEPVFGSGGDSQIIIRGFNRLHRLTRGVESRTFENMTDFELVALIALENGLTAAPSSAPTIRYDHVFQHNQTDLEFLQVRAALLGFDVWVENTTLFFDQRELAPPVTAAPRRSDGEVQLLVFHPRLASSATVQQVVVRGFDPAGGEIVGTATAPTIPLDPDDPDPILVFGRIMEFVEATLASQAEADAIATSKLEEVMLGYVTAEAEAKGNPRLKAGVVVEIAGIGDRLDGQYRIPKTTHRFGHGVGCDGGYVTLVRLRREDLGLFRLPAINDEVLVGFEHGDIRRPVIVGSLWDPDPRCSKHRP